MTMGLFVCCPDGSWGQPWRNGALKRGACRYLLPSAADRSAVCFIAYHQLIRADRLSGGKNNRRHCIVLVSIHFSSPESPSEFFGVEAAPDFVFLIAGRQPPYAAASSPEKTYLSLSIDGRKRSQKKPKSGVPIRYAASRLKREDWNLGESKLEMDNQLASKLGSQVTRGGNTAHRTVTMQMIMMKGITPLYTSWILMSPGRIPLT